VYAEIIGEEDGMERMFDYFDDIINCPIRKKVPLRGEP